MSSTFSWSPKKLLEKTGNPKYAAAWKTISTPFTALCTCSWERNLEKESPKRLDEEGRAKRGVILINCMPPHPSIQHVIEKNWKNRGEGPKEKRIERGRERSSTLSLISQRTSLILLSSSGTRVEKSGDFLASNTTTNSVFYYLSIVVFLTIFFKKIIPIVLLATSILLVFLYLYEL
jgi:hypothetical protein